MKQGVLTNGRVQILMARGVPCFKVGVLTCFFACVILVAAFSMCDTCRAMVEEMERRGGSL